MKSIHVLRSVLLGIVLIAAIPAAPADQTSSGGAAGELNSLEGTIRALYDVISGPAGRPRNPERFRSLFYPGARLVIVPPNPQGKREARVLTPEDYIEQTFPFLLENGFYEKEVANRTEHYGAIAHVWSTYEARRKADDPEPFMRGINSIQLLNDGERWWVVTIYWQRETPENPLPTKYQ